MTADGKVEENQLIDDQPKSSRRRSSSASDEKKSKKKKKDKGEKKGKKKDKKPKLKTIANKKLGKLTAEEKELMKHDWKEFTGDVSKQNLINSLDKAIKRRRRLYISDDPE